MCFYRQSDIPEIPELTWLLTCVTAKGLLNRAHAYKAAVDRNRAGGEDADAGINAGLYMYPVLMAADILLFNAHQVPVGRDQVQHIEMARDIAQRFNHTLRARAISCCPRRAIDENVATLPGLDGRKMSKSYDNTIPIVARARKALQEAIARHRHRFARARRSEGHRRLALFAHLPRIRQRRRDRRDAPRHLPMASAGARRRKQLFERIDGESRRCANATRR